MRCKNNCGAVTKTPARVETYSKWGLCRKCAIDRGLVVNNGYNVRKGSSISWRKGTGKYKLPKLTREEKKRKYWENAHENWAEMCYGGSNKVKLNPIKTHTIHGELI